MVFLTSYNSLVISSIHKHFLHSISYMMYFWSISFLPMNCASLRMNPVVDGLNSFCVHLTGATYSSKSLHSTQYACLKKKKSSFQCINWTITKNQCCAFLKSKVKKWVRKNKKYAVHHMDVNLSAREMVISWLLYKKSFSQLFFKE